MGRRTLLLIASILVAALGTSLVWLYVQAADARARENADLVPVLFLQRDAKAGTAAETLDLTTKQVSRAASAGAVTNRAALNGLTLRTDALTGQILLVSMVGKGEASRFPKGGAVAISIPDPNRVPADLKQGDIVDVYALRQGSAGARLVAAGVQVRSVGNLEQTDDATTRAGTGSIPVTTVGFDVDPATAKKLYDMVAAGEQPALYDHDPNLGTS